MEFHHDESSGGIGSQNRELLDAALFAEEEETSAEAERQAAEALLLPDEPYEDPEPPVEESSGYRLFSCGSGVYELQGDGCTAAPAWEDALDLSLPIQVHLPPEEFVAVPPYQVEDTPPPYPEALEPTEPEEPTHSHDSLEVLENQEPCEIVVPQERLDALPEEWTPEPVEVRRPLVLAHLASATLMPGESISLTDSHIRIEGADTPFLIDIMLLSPPEEGVLLRDGFALTGGDVFTQDDLNTGRIVYRHEGERRSDGFTFATPDHEIGPTRFHLDHVPARRPPELQGQPRVKLSAVGCRVAQILDGILHLHEPEAAPGLAVVAVAGRGSWEYRPEGAASWLHVEEVGPHRALLLGSTDQIRFLPRPGWGGKAQLTFRAWDRTAGQAGAYFDLARNPGTAFSTQVVTLATLVAPTPLRVAVPEPWLEPLRIEQLLGEAAAVVRLEGPGFWQFSLDGGISWHDFGAVYHGRARLLRAGDLVRFLPRRDAAGRVALGARPWNGEAGEAGEVVSLAGHRTVGNETPFGEMSQTRFWRLGID
ncbi:MAG: cadherin-like domain-containing protein [Gemmataceae bacterium]